MPTECSAECFDFGKVEGRPVEAAFDAGLVTSDAGALLLGATNRAIGMIDRFCGVLPRRTPARLIEYSVATLVGVTEEPSSKGTVHWTLGGTAGQ